MSQSCTAITRESVDILQERSERTNERYLRGLVTTFELYTIQSLFRNTQASLPVLESALEEAKGRLAILLGRYAGSLDEILAEGPQALDAVVLALKQQAVAVADRIDGDPFKRGGEDIAVGGSNGAARTGDLDVLLLLAPGAIPPPLAIEDGHLDRSRNHRHSADDEHQHDHPEPPPAASETSRAR